MKFLEKIKISKLKTSALALVMMFLFSMLPGNFVQASTASFGRNTTSISINSTPNDFEGVAAYLKAYHKLPSNYITKSQARRLGWSPSKGNLAKVAPGKSIGGDVFTNREKKLPYKRGRVWHECDIDYVSGFRNDKRILYSSDGLIYKTTDHYNTYTKMY